MADFGGILATLRKEEKQLAKRAAQVRSAIRALAGDGGAPIPLPRRKKTAAQKKAVSARMKIYWAAKRKKSAK